MEDFDIRKFITENQMTPTSRLVNEGSSGVVSAREFIDSNRVKYNESYYTEHLEAMIKFAQMHVTAALKAASELEESDGTQGPKIYPDQILNAYPLTNIK